MSRTRKNANSYHKLKVITYLDNSVKGLSKGADVTMFGINVGTVLDVSLKVYRRRPKRKCA